jgi:general secretion pathway protein G
LLGALSAGIAVGAAIGRSTAPQPCCDSLREIREVALREALFSIRSALDQHYADKGRYPNSLDELVPHRYLRELPTDPFTGSSNTWQVDREEGVPHAGVIDVHSGSGEIGRDGTAYNTW